MSRDGYCLHGDVIPEFDERGYVKAYKQAMVKYGEKKLLSKVIELTRREKNCLQLLKQGKNAKKIARELTIVASYC